MPNELKHCKYTVFWRRYYGPPCKIGKESLYECFIHVVDQRRWIMSNHDELTKHEIMPYRERSSSMSLWLRLSLTQSLWPSLKGVTFFFIFSPEHNSYTGLRKNLIKYKMHTLLEYTYQLFGLYFLFSLTSLRMDSLFLL